MNTGGKNYDETKGVIAQMPCIIPNNIRRKSRSPLSRSNRRKPISLDMIKGFAMILFVALVCLARASGQEPHQHQHDATEKLGQVRFPISCNPDAQQKFNRALALLHSFQYVEAEGAFTEITASEPDCAMAWWGEAMSMYHPLWLPPTSAELHKGREAIERARTANAKDTARKRLHCGARDIL